MKIASLVVKSKSYTIQVDPPAISSHEDLLAYLDRYYPAWTSVDVKFIPRRK